jgi:hypothetical protein
MISKVKKPRKKKDGLVTWERLLENSISRARKKQGMVLLNIGKVKTAVMLQEKLTKKALSGEDAAWDVQVMINTLH